MVIGLGSMMKLVRGGLGPDELAEVLSAAGMEVDFSPVSPGEELPAFRELGESASLPSSSILRIKAVMKGGDVLHGLLVVNQKSKQV